MLYLNLSRFELLLDPVPIELVLAWYPLEPALKLLTSDSLLVKSKSNPNGGNNLFFSNVWTAESCVGNGDKTLWGSIKVSGIILDIRKMSSPTLTENLYSFSPGCGNVMAVPL